MIVAMINLWWLLRNALVRLLRKPPDYVWVEVSGTLREFDWRPSFFKRRFYPELTTSPSVESLRGRMGRIEADGRSKGVVLRIQNLGASWTALEELRREILGFRERGGRVIAYLIKVDSRSYYLACAADEIFVAPLSTVNVVGVRNKVNFLKDSLAKVGVDAEVIAVSPYKSAGETLVRNDFSEESREQAERLLRNRFDEVVHAISRSRNISPEEVRSLVDRAPYSAPGALSERLLDGICYEDELSENLGDDGGRAKLVEWRVARGALKMPYRKRLRRRVGLVSLSGTIMQGRSQRLPFPLPLFGSEQAGSESVIGALRAAERNKRVAVVLFHVDSRGGEPVASDLIWREVERIRRVKPVVVLMGAAATSGGYYVSTAADHIVARRNTVTGSIGVFTARPIYAGLYSKLGVKPVSLEHGAHAGLFDASRYPSPDEVRILEDQLQFVYAEFKDRVASGRSLDLQDLEETAGGRVWTGVEARERGLVDEVGGFRSALRKAVELGKVEFYAPEVLLKISPPKSGRRIAPGRPTESIQERIAIATQAITSLRSTSIWVAAPYDIHED